ncbi:MAG: adenosylcobinamide-GDP ribazoletransferase [Cyanobacteriota bacterium]|jgi:adenosylcobinamide-GDP ribazoletransferase
MPARFSATPPVPPSWLQDLAGAWIFYSVLPPWPGVPPRFERIARFAPWVGLVIGGLQALLWWALEGHAPPLAQVCVVLAAGLLLTGGLHMDGAMDTADGLAAGERMLEAMRDSRVGASGAQALALVLLLKAAALATLGSGAPGALVWAALWGRMAPLLAVAWFPYLHPRGSAAFHRRHWAGLLPEARPGLLAIGALLLLSLSRGWPLLGVAGALPALLVPGWLGRRLGGHSGDSYGACVEWTEVMALGVSAMAGVIAGAVALSGPAG